MNLDIKKENLLYIITISFLVITIIYLYFFTKDFVFFPIYNVIFAIFSVVITFLIFLKANFIYSKTSDKRMAVMGAGFITGGLFEFIHAFHSYNPIIEIQFLYFFFEALAFIIAIYLTLFFKYNPITEKPKDFLAKVYLGFSAYFVFINIIILLIGHAKLAVFYTSVPIESTFAALFFLNAFIYYDMRNYLDLKPFCFYIFGLILFGIGELYIPSEIYSVSKYRFLGHLLDVGGLFFIFLGLNDILFKIKIFTLKQKMVLFQTLTLTFFYLILLLVIHFLFKITFPLSVQYIALASVLIMAFIQYILSDKFSSPIRYLISEVEKYTPEKKPEKISVVSKDEVSILTNEFNKNAELIWQYIKKINKQAARETLVKDIVETIRSSLDIQQTKLKIVNEVGKVFNADRCYLRIYDKKLNKFLAPDVEYLKEGMSSLSNFSVDQSGLKYFIDKYEKNKTNDAIIVNNEVFDKENLWNSPLEEYFKQVNIKTDIAIPMQDRENFIYFLVLHYRQNLSAIPRDDIELMETIAKQIIEAVNQAILFEYEKKSAIRERLLREFISIIRSTFDRDAVIHFFVNELAKYINADRVLFVKFDNNNFVTDDNYFEYLRNSESFSFINYDWKQEEIKPILSSLLDKEEINFSDVNDYLKENNLENTETSYLFKKAEICSAYSFIIKHVNEIKGFVFISYKDEKVLSDEEIQFIKILSNQIGIALHQSELFIKEKRASEKERILKEIISEVKLSQDLNTAYNYIIYKIATIFNADRVIFIETPMSKIDKAYIKCEYLKNQNLKPLKGSPDIISKTFLKKMKS